jgi:hypothetical protein
MLSVIVLSVKMGTVMAPLKILEMQHSDFKGISNRSDDKVTLNAKVQVLHSRAGSWPYPQTLN